MKISVKILLVMIIIAVFLVAIPSYFIINSFVKHERETIEKNMLEKNSNTMDKISRLMYQNVVNLRNLSNPGNKILANPNFSEKEKMDYLQNFQKNAKSYSTISLYDTNGIKIIDSENVDIGKNDSKSEFFIKALSGETYVDKSPTYEVDFQQYILHLSAPEQDTNNKTVGVIVLNFPMIRIAELLGNERYADDDIDLVTDSGLVVYSNHNKDYILTNVWNGTQILQEISQSQTPYVSGISNDVEGEQVVFAASRATHANDYLNTGWILITNENVQEAFSRIDQLQSQLMIISFIIFSASIISLILLSKMITTPITKLVKISKEIASGDFSVRDEPKNKDEFSELIHSFNIMSQSLQENKAKLIRTERLSSMGDLSARIAHDLRNPLAVIKNALEIIKIKNSNLDEVTLRSMQAIERAVTRMAHQIENVLDYVKSNPLELKRQSVLSLLDSTIANIPHDDKITINLHGDNVEILCDTKKLEVVFANLIINAIQAMEGNGAIDVTVSATPKYAQIEVKDSGPGISSDVLPKIFNPLFTTKQVGTGLGLSSCKTIITMHRGTIDVKSKLGEGTTFIIKIPILTPEPSDEITASDQVLQKIQDMNGRDHLALEYGNEEDMGLWISEFVKKGLNENLLSIFIITEEEIGKYSTLLSKNGINTSELVKSQDLMMISHENLYHDLKESFSFESIESYLKEVTTIVKIKKKDGLNIVSTVTGDLLEVGKVDDCISMEERWHNFIPGFKIPINLICLYKFPINGATIPLIDSHNMGLMAQTIFS